MSECEGFLALPIHIAHRVEKKNITKNCIPLEKANGEFYSVPLLNNGSVLIRIENTGMIIGYKGKFFHFDKFGEFDEPVILDLRNEIEIRGGHWSIYSGECGVFLFNSKCNTGMIYEGGTIGSISESFEGNGEVLTTISCYLFGIGNTPMSILIRRIKKQYNASIVLVIA